jgi:hypothetical protein
MTEAVVAVKTAYVPRWEKNGRWEYGCWEYLHFLLHVSERSGSLWVELDEAFVPEEDHLGQLLPDTGLSVRIGDEFFLSPLLLSCNREKELTELKKKYRLVKDADANLLCRFIVGTATAEEVRAAAEELITQTVDAPALLAKLAKAEVELSQIKGENEQLSGMCQEYRGSISGMFSGNRVAAIEAVGRRLLLVEAVLDILCSTDPVGATNFWGRRKGAKLARIEGLVKEEASLIGKELAALRST